jgi:hypothetical protein
METDKTKHWAFIRFHPFLSVAQNGFKENPLATDERR